MAPRPASLDHVNILVRGADRSQERDHGQGRLPGPGDGGAR